MAIRIPIITTFDKRGVDKALSNINGLSRQAGKAAGALAAGVAVGIGASVREFAKFESALNQSLAIMGDVSDTMQGEMADAAREVAKQTTFSAEQAAESFFFLASAGLDAEQSVAALPQVAKFAQAGMFDMATATDLATDAQSALGLASDDAQQNLDNLTRVTDVFVKANTLANTSVEQLATALTTKAGTALKNVGKDVEEGAAALAVFADQGIKGERAGTLLTNTIFGLTDRVEAVPEKFEELGISVFDASGNLRNFSEISDQFTVALGEMTTEQKVATLSQLGFTKQSREGLLALLGQSDALKTYEAALRDAGGTAQVVADKQLETFNGQLSLLGSEVQDVAIEIGSQLAPVIADLIPVISDLLPKIGEELVRAVEKVDFEGLLQGVENFISFVADNINKLDDLIIGLAAVAAGLKGFTVAIGIARTAATAFGITLTAALGPIGLVGAALGVLGVGLGAYALKAKETVPEQEKLNQKIIDARIRLNEYETAQKENANSSKLYQSAIDDTRAELNELRAAQAAANEFTNAAKEASFGARDAAIANRLASQDLIPALDNSATGYNNIAQEAANAQLGVSQLALTEQARAIQAEEIARIQLYGGQASEARSFQEILNALTARTQFQTQAFYDNQEAVREIGAAMGLVVPEFEAGADAMSSLSSSTDAAADSYAKLAANLGQATAAQRKQIEGFQATPIASSRVPGGGSGQAVVDPDIGTIGDLPIAEQEFLKEAFPDLFPEAALATGGIVMKPTRALIGEAGPEAVIPLDRADGVGKTENYININIDAGVGTDPVSVGRAVVDAIRRYESTNGKVFASA